MAIDPEARKRRRLDMFRQVAEERVGKLNLLWIEVERSAGDPAAFLREAHTLKGEASLTGFALTSKLVHAVEDYVKLVRDRGRAPEQHDGDVILSGLDLVLRLTRGEPDAPSSDAEAFLAKVAGLLGEPAETTQGLVLASARPAETRTQAEHRGVPSSSDGGKGTPEPASVRRESSIRVTSEKIDHLRDMVSDLLLCKVRWRQLTRSTRRLRESADALRIAKSIVLADGCGEKVSGLVAGLSDLESRLRDESHDLERLIGELDSTTRDLRMIPLGTLFDHFPVPLRQLARSLGRSIRFEVAGEQVEVDKALLEMLEDPLLHLLRNAIDHGVEPPTERLEAGKSPEATVRVAAGLVGQRLRLVVSDDGRGIDADAVRKRALATGLLDPNLADQVNESQILRTIFAAGFSTRDQISELSGRGIGLNIVLDIVENLGGKVDVHSEPGRGTTFEIEVPLTVAITRVVLFRVGMGIYALPAASVRSLVEARTMARSIGPEGSSVMFSGTAVPLLDLGNVLGEATNAAAEARIVIAQSGTDLVALAGTSGHLEREVMLKPMGKFFEKLPLVPAAVNLEEGGSLALVLKAAELVLLARSRGRKLAPPVEPEARTMTSRIALVADDSPVVRDVIAQALRSYGLHVLVAGDGEEALAVLGAHTQVDIVVTDIDMPRLDGLGLVRALRSRQNSRDMPVVAISMRGSEPEKRAAMEAGMSAYIDKSEFNRALLWKTIRPFVVRP